MKAALYARISTSNHGQNPEMQLAELRQYCERRGWQVVGEYTDAGVSGTKQHRPALDKLMADGKKRKFDAVVVYRYDRFARSLRHLITALDEFQTLGIEFVSLHEGVDTSTPGGRLVFSIFASIAEFERSLICDRVRSGIAHAKAKGKTLGRPRVPANTAAVVKLRAQGASWSEVCAKTGLSQGTARRASLANKPSENQAA